MKLKKILSDIFVSKFWIKASCVALAFFVVLVMNV